MAAISGVSSTSGFSAIQGVGRTPPIRGQRQPDKATFEQDLLQSGLNANVSTDELLKSVQSSIKSAINDPSNNGKDFFEVLQSAVQKTLKDNGVDTEKLTALLQSQIPDQAGLSAHGGGTGSGRPEGPDRAGSNGPPPAGGHRHGHPPTDSSATVGPSIPSILDDGDEDDSGTQSATKTASAKSATGSKVNDFGPDNVASQFKRLISDLIKSLPSGSTLDVKA